MATHLVRRAVDSVQGLQDCKTVFCAFMATLQGACTLAEGSYVYQPSHMPALRLLVTCRVTLANSLQPRRVFTAHALTVACPKSELLQII